MKWNEKKKITIKQYIVHFQMNPFYMIFARKISIVYHCLGWKEVKRRRKKNQISIVVKKNVVKMQKYHRKIAIISKRM